MTVARQDQPLVILYSSDLAILQSIRFKSNTNPTWFQAILSSRRSHRTAALGSSNCSKKLCNRKKSQGIGWWPGGLPGWHRRGWLHCREAFLLRLHINVNHPFFHPWRHFVRKFLPLLPFLLTSEIRNIAPLYFCPGKLFARRVSLFAASGVAATWIWQQLPCFLECGKYKISSFYLECGKYQIMNFSFDLMCNIELTKCQLAVCWDFTHEGSKWWFFKDFKKSTANIHGKILCLDQIREMSGVKQAGVKAVFATLYCPLPLPNQSILPLPRSSSPASLPPSPPSSSASPSSSPPGGWPSPRRTKSHQQWKRWNHTRGRLRPNLKQANLRWRIQLKRLLLPPQSLTGSSQKCHQTLPKQELQQLRRRNSQNNERKIYYISLSRMKNGELYQQVVSLQSLNWYLSISMSGAWHLHNIGI